MVAQWLADPNNLIQFCVTTLPGGRGLDLANFIAQTSNQGVRFASCHQATSLGPLNFYWELPHSVPPNTLPATVDFDRLPKDLRTRIESVLTLVSDLPIPFESRGIFTSTSYDGPWDKDLPPSFSQWRARLSFIGDQL